MGTVLYWGQLSTLSAKRMNGRLFQQITKSNYKSLERAQRKILSQCSSRFGMAELNFPLKGQRNFICLFFPLKALGHLGKKKNPKCNFYMRVLKLNLDMYEWNHPERLWNTFFPTLSKTCCSSEECYWSRLFFFFYGLCSVCGRWWATQAAYGHPRCGTT